MTATATQTTTFTVADIRKVVENFAADFSMMAQATGLWSRESVAEVVYDLRVFAEYGYLVSVSVILRDAGGNKIRAAVYSVSEAASSWKSEQPGNNLWPKTVGGSLKFKQQQIITGLCLTATFRDYFNLISCQLRSYGRS